MPTRRSRVEEDLAGGEVAGEAAPTEALPSSPPEPGVVQAGVSRAELATGGLRQGAGCWTAGAPRPARRRPPALRPPERPVGDGQAELVGGHFHFGTGAAVLGVDEFDEVGVRGVEDVDDRALVAALEAVFRQVAS